MPTGEEVTFTFRADATSMLAGVTAAKTELIELEKWAERRVVPINVELNKKSAEAIGQQVRTAIGSVAAPAGVASRERAANAPTSTISGVSSMMMNPSAALLGTEMVASAAVVGAVVVLAAKVADKLVAAGIARDVAVRNATTSLDYAGADPVVTGRLAGRMGAVAAERNGLWGSVTDMYPVIGPQHKAWLDEQEFAIQGAAKMGQSNRAARVAMTEQAAALHHDPVAVTEAQITARRDELKYQIRQGENIRSHAEVGSPELQEAEKQIMLARDNLIAFNVEIVPALRAVAKTAKTTEAVGLAMDQAAVHFQQRGQGDKWNFNPAQAQLSSMAANYAVQTKGWQGELASVAGLDKTDPRRRQIETIVQGKKEIAESEMGLTIRDMAWNQPMGRVSRASEAVSAYGATTWMEQATQQNNRDISAVRGAKAKAEGEGGDVLTQILRLLQQALGMPQ